MRRNWLSAGILLMLGVFVMAAESSAEQKLLDASNAMVKDYSSCSRRLQYAKALYDAGYRVAAFYVSEDARDRFPPEVFDKRFDECLIVPVKSLLSEDEYDKIGSGGKDAVMAAYRKKAETDPTAAAYVEFLTKYDGMWDSDSPDDIAKVRDALLELGRRPGMMDCPEYLSFASRWLLKTAHDEPNAKFYYLRDYFANPHYYDGEYAEYRIKMISSQTKKAEFEAVLKSAGGNLMAVIEKYKYANPRILDVCLDRAAAGAKIHDAAPLFFAALQSPDMYVQARAIKHLCDDCDLSVHAPEVRAMLVSPDLIQQSIAALLVSKALPRAEALAELKKLSGSDAELIRLDAASALKMLSDEPMEGGRAF